MTKTRTLSFLAAAAALLLAGTALAAAPKKTPDLVKKGKASYETNCSVCHGPLGHGDGEGGGDPKPRNFVADKFKNGTKPDQVFGTLKKGMDGTAMVSFGHLPDEELWGLAYYVLELRAAKK